MSLLLFENTNEFIKLPMPDANVVYNVSFLPPTEAKNLFEYLLSTIPWQQDQITVFGKTHLQPRLTALFATNNKPYRYSNVIMHPHKMPPVLQELLASINKHCDVAFTTCLANLYRDGQDSNGWHADDEKELGSNPIIASLSLGEARWFHFKHKTDKSLKKKVWLTSGSLLIMGDGTQENWLHQVPKSKKITNPRINLTFRKILE
ncbi:alpha-ketoglutarate-dependent dioxygenase AlkB [Aquimarina sp. W85]|uniref:alpha-ketoglutarate-dependent dioxygenase AlkB family protein n=1 Tax=Aquimarina rhodophyticola TaxID=3342246 RepID=UPI00366A802D